MTTTKKIAHALALQTLVLLAAAETQGQTPGEQLPAWTQAASSCVIDEAAASQSTYAFSNADLTYRPGMMSQVSGGAYQPLVARCNVLNPLDKGNPAWNRLVVGYLDSNGAGSISVKLKRLARSTGVVSTIVTWTDPPSSGLFTRLEDYRDFRHTFNFLANSYYVEISVLRHDNDGNPGVFMIRLAGAVPPIGS